MPQSKLQLNAPSLRKAPDDDFQSKTTAFQTKSKLADLTEFSGSPSLRPVDMKKTADRSTVKVSVSTTTRTTKSGDNQLQGVSLSGKEPNTSYTVHREIQSTPGTLREDIMKAVQDITGNSDELANIDELIPSLRKEVRISHHSKDTDQVKPSLRSYQNTIEYDTPSLRGNQTSKIEYGTPSLRSNQLTNNEYGTPSLRPARKQQAQSLSKETSLSSPVKLSDPTPLAAPNKPKDAPSRILKPRLSTGNIVPRSGDSVGMRSSAKPGGSGAAGTMPEETGVEDLPEEATNDKRDVPSV